MMELKIERIYTNPVDLDGYRILVDRIWPRGISKENAHLDKWLKEVGPSTELRKWFGHDVARYPEFKERYLAELTNNPVYYCNSLKAIVQSQLPSQNVILLYGAKDEEHNQAVILADKLRKDLQLAIK